MMNAMVFKTSTRLTVGGLLRILKETNLITDPEKKFYQTQVVRNPGWHAVTNKSPCKYYAFRYHADQGDLDEVTEKFVKKWDGIIKSYLDLLTVSYDGPGNDHISPFEGKSITDPSIQDKHIIAEFSVPTALMSNNYISNGDMVFDKGIDALIKTWTYYSDIGSDEKLVRWALRHGFGIDCIKYPVVTEEALKAAINVYRQRMEMVENLYFDPKMIELSKRIEEVIDANPDDFLTSWSGNRIFPKVHLFASCGKIHDPSEIKFGAPPDEFTMMVYKYYCVLLQKFIIRYEAMKNQYVME